MVVARGKVDHHVVKLVALLNDFVEKGLHFRVVLSCGELDSVVSFVLWVTDVAMHELVEAVRAALDAINGAVGSADLTDGKDAAVTRRADRSGVILSRDFTGLWLESSGEEIGKGRIELKAVALCLLNLDAVDLREETEHGTSEARQNVHLADVASDSGLDTGHRNDVLPL